MNEERDRKGSYSIRTGKTTNPTLIASAGSEVVPLPGGANFEASSSCHFVSGAMEGNLVMQ